MVQISQLSSGKRIFDYSEATLEKKFNADFNLNNEKGKAWELAEYLDRKSTPKVDEQPPIEEAPSIDREPSVIEDITFFPTHDDPEMLTITFRSCLVGVIQAIVAAIVGQLFIYKPVINFLQPLFLQITAMIFGRALQLIPGPKWWNPGAFTMKETVFASIMSATARTGAFSIYTLATEDLIFQKETSFLPATAMLLSSQLIGYGWGGLFQPILVYPAQGIYPQVLPSATLFYTLFNEGVNASDQLKFFKKMFALSTFYEIIPTYIMPALQSVSLLCLAFPGSSTVTDLFGGVRPFEGMGWFMLSLDWMLVGGSGPLYTPLFTLYHQVAAWIFTTIVLRLGYTNSWFGAGKKEGFPFLSVSLFSSNATVYPTREVINNDGTANLTMIDTIGLPLYTATNALTQVFQSLSISSAVSHVILYNWELIVATIKRKAHGKAMDPHRLVVQKSYRDVHLSWFAGIWALGLILALAACGKDSGLPYHGLVLAVFFSAFLILGVGFVSAISGCMFFLFPVTQMVGGLCFPGNAFGNMWFSTATSVAQALNMISDLKLGQYMHMSPAKVVIAQGSGTVVGVIVNYLVMKSVINTQREALLLPSGDGVYSGLTLQNYGISAVAWGTLSHSLYIPGKRYFAVPAALGLGLLLPVPFFVLNKIWPNKTLAKINMPIFFGMVGSGGQGLCAGKFTSFTLGFLSQFWARKYHHEWFQKYNYILSAALDGGTQILVLLLSLTFQGCLGFKVDFPVYFLNPSADIPRDYCYLAEEIND
ncbi:OPT oligopeptide transporter protein-domain-containing protein [Phakopsora pachyrhizi]|nr:OPT oligopeptide transporter protein-domain-containing protein [Phakopsora pachyrhizi]